MSPEQLLRTYFHAKDENRPHLLSSVFSPDAHLQIRNRSEQISFPAITVGLEGIADVLVRRFNQAYENIYSFYLDRPGLDSKAFTCDWLVGMTDKESRSVRVGCGCYEWTFRCAPALLATRLIITIDAVTVLDASRLTRVMGWLNQLQYPWTSAAEVLRAIPRGELTAVYGYVGRHSEPEASPGRDRPKADASGRSARAEKGIP